MSAVDLYENVPESPSQDDNDMEGIVLIDGIKKSLEEDELDGDLAGNVESETDSVFTEAASSQYEVSTSSKCKRKSKSKEIPASGSTLDRAAELEAAKLLGIFDDTSYIPVEFLEQAESWMKKELRSSRRQPNRFHEQIFESPCNRTPGKSKKKPSAAKSCPSTEIETPTSQATDVQEVTGQVIEHLIDETLKLDDSELNDLEHFEDAVCDLQDDFI
ncbi:hypothetical protein HDE_05568 [Halotydeus destructor]|nr:hypothetical protein HDE_05568 [Halotydeus destructor]